MTTKRWLSMPVVLLLGCCNSFAHAAMHQLNGDGFKVVYDDALLGQYGAPTLTLDGKTILFSPVNLLVKAVGTQGNVVLSDSLSFDIIPDAGVRVSGVKLAMDGDYRLVRRSGGAAPSATVFGEFRLTELLDQQFVTQSLGLDHSQPFDILCNSTACPAKPWAASANLAAPEVWGSAPVRTLLTDTLAVASFGMGDSAFLEKQATTQTISILTQTLPQQNGNVSSVPLPAGLPLLLSGLLGVLGVARTRRQSSGFNSQTAR